MIIITGLGRCGTSFVTLLFKELGFGVGNSLSYDDDLKAGMELAPAYAISRDMYDDYIKKGEEIDLYVKTKESYWHRAFGKTSFRDRILMIDESTPEDRKEGKVEVIKDPRFTWHPKLIRAWWKIRKDLKIILLHRKPEDIIRSRAKVAIAKWESDAYFQDPKRGQDLKQFYDDYELFVNEINSLGIPYVYFLYPDFVYKSCKEILDKLNKVDIASDISLEKFEDTWNKIFDRSKISFFGGEDEVILHKEQLRSDIREYN